MMPNVFKSPLAGNMKPTGHTNPLNKIPKSSQDAKFTTGKKDEVYNMRINNGIATISATNIGVNIRVTISA